MKTTFEFEDKTSEEDRSKPVKIQIGKPGHLEEFTLKNDLTGIELLERISAAATGTRGVLQFFYRVVEDDDWERFKKATAHLKPEQFTEVVGDLIDVYARFPTSQDEGSSTG